MENQEIKMIQLLLIGSSCNVKDDIMGPYFGCNPSEEEIALKFVELREKILTIDGESIKLKVCTECGQDSYPVITRGYVAHADGIVFIFDFTDEYSFEKCKKWLESFQFDSVNGDVFLIGNHCDLDKVIQKLKLPNSGVGIKIRFYEVSGLNIDETFFDIAKTINERKEKKKFEVHKQQEPKEKHSNKELCVIF